MKGENERLLYEILNDAYPGEWANEHKGIEGRRFRFDCANPERKIAIEIEGGIWMGHNGGHTNGIGYENNMKKYNMAVVAGWKVLRYSPETLRKRHWQIISDIRRLCGFTDEGQKTLDLDGCTQATLKQVQVKLS